MTVASATLHVMLLLYVVLQTVHCQIVPVYYSQIPYTNLPGNTPSNVPRFCFFNNVWQMCDEDSSSYKTTMVPEGVSELTSQFFNTRRSFDHPYMDYETAVRFFNLLQKIPPDIAEEIKEIVFGYWNKLRNAQLEGAHENNQLETPYLKDGNKPKNGKELYKINDINFSFHSELSPMGSSRLYFITKFIHALDHLERTLYATTYAKLSVISPPERQVNGISFALSGLFLQMSLIALSTEADPYTKAEIDKCTGFNISDEDKIEVLKSIMSWLPVSSDRLKIRYATRLVLRKGIQLSMKFLMGAASAIRLKIDYVNGKETPDNLSQKLNHMVEVDSGGAMRNTFEEDEVSGGVCAVLISTVYVRARWRSPPTLLNGSLPFNDDERAPQRTTRMIRINDIMRYVYLEEWDVEALEIKYATTGLTLLLLVPRGRSLRNLAAHMTVTNVQNIANRMQSQRIAAILPLFTLRMTLLLPAKLQALGISRLIDLNTSECHGLKLSHAVQRIMFWAEAGRYAFKDDGIEWDETPEQTVIFNRPFLFYVRWHNVTILNGNFVL